MRGPFAVWLVLVLGAAAPTRAALPAAQAALLDSLQSLSFGPRPDDALAVSEVHVAAARAHGDSAFLCALLLLQGGGEAARGRGLGAEPRLREAFALATAAGDTTSALRALRWLSVAVQLQSRDDEAHALYHRLHDLAVAADDSLHLAWSLVGQGYHAFLHEEAPASIALYREAAGIFARRHDVRGEQWARNGHALALRRDGRLREAAAAFRRSAELSATAGDAMNEAMAWNFLGELALIQGDPAFAVTCFETSRRIHLGHDYPREAVAVALNLARSQQLLGRHDDALAGLGDALITCRREGYRDLEGLVLVAEARLRLREGRPREAATLCRRVLAMRPPPPPGVVNWAELRLVEALAAQDSAAAGLAVLDRSRVVPSHGQDALVGLELGLARGRLLLALGRPAEARDRLADAARGATLASLPGIAADAHAAEARAWTALGAPDSALARLRRGIDAWESERSLPTDPEWRERRGAAGAELFTEAASLLVDGGRTAAAFDLAQRYKARTLQERLAGTERRDDVAAIDLRALQAVVLRPGEVLLDAYVGPRTSLVFVVTKDDCAAAALPDAAALGRRLAPLGALLANPGSAAAGERLVRTARAACAEILPALPASARTVIWSPDGPLQTLPLALLDDEPRAGQRVPSAAILAALRRRPDRAAAAPTILTVTGADAPPGAAAEAAWLARRFRGVRDAQGDLAGGDVIHVATHAWLDEQRPWNSSIALDDSLVLRAGEVATLDLQARLAVLACCAGAGGTVVSGEGALGLATGFLSAGATAVLGSLWPVDDRATSRFMADIYRALADGSTAAEALAAAQAATRRRPETSHPFYWAGFVLIGDGSVTVPLVARGTRWWPWLLAGGVAAAAAAAITSRRTGRPEATDGCRRRPPRT